MLYCFYFNQLLVSVSFLHIYIEVCQYTSETTCEVVKVRPETSGTAVGLQRFREHCDSDRATDSFRTLEEMQASLTSRKFPKVFIPRKQHCGEFLLNTGTKNRIYSCHESF